MNKKIILISVVIVVIVVLIGVYYLYHPKLGLPTAKEGEKIILNSPGQKTDSNTSQKPKGSLTVCRDACGDGACLTEVVCQDLNCPCPENAETCPQDCKNGSSPP